MEEKDEIKFKITVPYNNAYMVASRKKQKTITGILLLACALLFGFFLVMSLTSNNSVVFATVIFAVMTAVSITSAISLFCTIKPNSKNDNISIGYVFYDNSLLVYQEDAETQKKLTFCLYRSAQNKQFVSKAIEDANKIEFKIYIGSYNMVPQYKKYLIPKESIKAEQIEALREFLKQNLGNDYVIKQ